MIDEKQIDKMYARIDKIIENKSFIPKNNHITEEDYTLIENNLDLYLPYLCFLDEYFGAKTEDGKKLRKLLSKFI